MAIISTIVGSIGSVVSHHYVGAVLAPVVAVFKAVQIVPVTLAVAVLWGMTTKGPDEQAWSFGDYAIVIPLAVAIAHSGPSLIGTILGEVRGVLP